MPRPPDRFTPTDEELAQEATEAPWAERKEELFEKLSDARALLLMKHHFFGRLALKMKVVLSDRIDTAAVRADATCLFNPRLVDGLDVDELGFVFAHELMHLAYGHFDRQAGKDPNLWNRAGDYVINDTLVRAGMTMPQRQNLRPLHDKRYRELGDEQVYHLLREEQREEQKQQQQQESPEPEEKPQGTGGPPRSGDADGAPQEDTQGEGGGGQEGDEQEQDGQQEQGGSGGGEQEEGDRTGFGTGGSDCDFGATEDLRRKAEHGDGRPVRSPEEWRDEILNAAEAAKSRGQLPSSLERWVEELRDPVLPWEQLLQRAVSQILKTGSSYRRPSRRSAALRGMRGLPRGVSTILPGPEPDRKHVAIAIDTSGSMSDEELRDSLSEVKDVLRYYDRPIRVMAVDADVHVDEDIRDVGEIELRGGGGTSTEPVFERIEEDPGQWGDPAMLIYFTDLHASFPDRPPEYPTLWVNTAESESPEPPFGDVIDLHPEKVRAHLTSGHDRPAYGRRTQSMLEAPSAPAAGTPSKPAREGPTR